MNNKRALILSIAALTGCGGDDGPGITQTTIFLQNGCSSEEEVQVFEIIDSSDGAVDDVVLKGQFSTNSPTDLTCGGTEGVSIDLRENGNGDFEIVDLIYLTSNMKYYEESFDPNQIDCVKTTDCFDFQFPAAQRNGAASEVVLIDKPDIEALDLEMEISEATINCFGVGVGGIDGQLIDIALFEVSESNDLLYHLNDEDLEELKDYFRTNTSPIFYLTLYDIYKSSKTTPQFTAILKLKTSDQESCLNSSTCLLFKKVNIGNTHPIQSARLYYWKNF